MIAEINEKSNYSPEVNAYINSVEELEIYQKAGLEEIQINGRTCLIRSDIDMDQVVDEFGMTNADLIKEGSAPYDQNGNKIELHGLKNTDLRKLILFYMIQVKNPKSIEATLIMSEKLIGKVELKPQRRMRNEYN